MLALVACYFAAAQLVFALEVAGPVAAIVWLPVGVAIAFLYLGGAQLWPGVLIGDLLVNDYGAGPIGTALVQTCGNVIEVLVAVWLLHRLVPDGAPLGSIRGLAGMLVALSVATLVSATIGCVAQLAGDVIEGAAFPTVWRTWWLGDLVGALVLVPLAAAWCRWPPRTLWAGRLPEASVLLVVLVVVSELATRSHRPLTYLVFPVLVVAALRFRQRGATLAVAVAAGFTVLNVSQYAGPFIFSSVTSSVLSTQLFIIVGAVTTFCLAAVVSEREALSAGLRASRARLVETSDTERRQVVRNLHDGAQQRLSALVVHLRLAAEDSLTLEQSQALIACGADEISTAIEELRELAHGLPPAALTKVGLAGAIRSIALRASVPVTLVALPEGRLDDTAEATAYYVIAEAVTNAQRYAHASSIEVSAVVGHRVLVITVADGGVGGASEQMSSGLQGLRDRVEAIGGSFELESPPGHGTRVTAEIPAMAA